MSNTKRVVYLILFLSLSLVVPSVAAIKIFEICTTVTMLVETGHVGYEVWVRVLVACGVGLAMAYGWSVFTTYYFCKLLGIKNTREE